MAERGQVVADMQEVSAGEALVIRPPEGEEWVIHNIYHEVDAQLIRVKQIDASTTSEIVVDSHSGNGGWLGFAFHVTNTHYIKVENTSSSSGKIGYDGIITRV